MFYQIQFWRVRVQTDEHFTSNEYILFDKRPDLFVNYRPLQILFTSTATSAYAK